MARAGQVAGAATMSVGSGSALLFGGRVLEYLAVGVAGVLIARGLGPEGRGVYSLVNQAAFWSSAFLAPGLAEAAVYYWGRGRHPVASLWGNYVTWWLGACLLLAAAAGVVLAADRHLFGIAPRFMVLALAGGAAMLFVQGAQTLMLGQGRAGRNVAVQVAGPVVRLLAIGGALAFGLTLPLVLGIWLGAVLATAVLAIALVGLPMRPALDLAALRDQVVFGGKGFAGWVLTAVNHRLDVFIVGGLLGAAAVGQYTVAFNTAELTWWVPLAVGTVLYPKASSLSAADAAELSASACRATLLLGAAATALLAAVGYKLIPLAYGGEFRESVPAFYILLPSGLLYTVTKVLSSSLWALGRPEISVLSGLASVPATLGLNFLLVPRLGIEGSAVASDVAYLLNALVVLAIFSRATGMPWWRALVPGRDDLRAVTDGARGLWAHRLAARVPGENAPM